MPLPTTFCSVRIMTEQRSGPRACLPAFKPQVYDWHVIWALANPLVSCSVSSPIKGDRSIYTSWHCLHDLMCIWHIRVLGHFKLLLIFFRSEYLSRNSSGILLCNESSLIEIIGLSPCWTLTGPWILLFIRYLSFTIKKWSVNLLVHGSSCLFHQGSYIFSTL